MPKFVIIEIQQVKAVREVEAADRDDALEIFHDGGGKPVGKDGDIAHSEIISCEQIED